MTGAKGEPIRHGTVVALLRRPATNAPTEDVSVLELDAEHGVAGDHGTSKKRQVTLLSEEAWSEASRELGHPVPWQARRANVLLSGIDLARSVGRKLRLGECLLEIRGETRPCDEMDKAAAGLKEKLVPDWRGGVYASIIRGGIVRPGERASWEGQADDPALR